MIHSVLPTLQALGEYGALTKGRPSLGVLAGSFPAHVTAVIAWTFDNRLTVAAVFVVLLLWLMLPSRSLR